MSQYYGLDPITHEIFPIDNVIEWGRWFETAQRVVSQDYVGAIQVSTVFLGIDHNYFGGTPVLFETMLFGDVPEDWEYQERYTTYEQAAAGHVEVVKRLMTGQPLYDDT